MTNFEKLIQSKEEMAICIMCPYALSEEEVENVCNDRLCIDCCLEWLNTEAE